ncbi:VRR-NUC domain-containing protein [Aquariibacter albus]|uniref:VRR-NUC domain-containing protein n=1 Tax=Aquariibacter albus TaxID=2759899 RepID=A0A839HU04_9BURK|nr:VRR-NUC domain-containing protein [Aquariibacter albus]MBB1161504.1 VRR-NUC domain-containing protein [Aquariibacter albus]
MRERDIERHLVERVKQLGGEVRKVQWIGRRGAPDRLVMLPGRSTRNPDGSWFYRNGSAIWVELKALGAKPEAHQLREHERMRAMGQRVVVIDSVEGVEELLA